MKVLVLGSGVIGVTTAYYLARAGHEVTVVDRQPEPALETSFANAGEVSPGYSAPWAAPGLPLKAIKWLFMRHRPLSSGRCSIRRCGVWGLRVLAQLHRCRATKSTRTGCCASPSTAATASRRCAPIPASATTSGCRARCNCSARRAGRRRGRRHGDPRALRRSARAARPRRLRRAEPALARVQEKFAGGLRLPGDETGDCFKFTQASRRSRRNRASFPLQATHVRGVAREGGRVAGVATDAGEMAADAYVVALGSYSPLCCARSASPFPSIRSRAIR